jgi:hypothetical protein
MNAWIVIQWIKETHKKDTKNNDRARQRNQSQPRTN